MPHANHAALNGISSMPPGQIIFYPTSHIMSVGDDLKAQESREALEWTHLWIQEVEIEARCAGGSFTDEEKKELPVSVVGDYKTRSLGSSTMAAKVCKNSARSPP